MNLSYFPSLFFNETLSSPVNTRRRDILDFLAQSGSLGRSSQRRDDVSRLVYDQEVVEIARLVFGGRHCGAVPVESTVDEGLDALISVRKPALELKRHLRFA